MVAIALSAIVVALAAPASVDGQRTAWHPLTLTFAGPQAAETDNSPNPFLDIRLQVEFLGPNNQRYDVPGFFDGDGEASPTGNVWRARFTPDAPGTWHYTARFRRGPQVAIALEPGAGEAFLPAGLSEADLTGTFDVTPRDPEAPGYLKYGCLGYAGGHYLKFADGPYWLRGGTDEPENLLAFEGFANTPPKHHYEDHVRDWRDGDPDWGDASAVCGRGRAIIGMVNYLASQDVNSMYFLLMNVGGDGKDVWPWAGKINGRGSPDDDNLHFDVLKLRQWNTVFEHAQRKGVMLHMVLNEAEEANKRELDNGELGPERKLFYREMVARFAHHLAIEWNLCEEYNLNFDYGPLRMGAFANYLRAVDPYDHPIAAHSAGDPVEALRFMYGDPRYDMVSVQLNQRPIHEVTEAIWRETAKAGRPLPVSLDEFTLDRGQKASHIPVDDAEGHRREKLWPTYLSGGQIEFILEGLLKVDTFRTPEREKLWRYTAIARHFLEDNLPFWEMQPSDGLVTGAGSVALPIGKGKTQPLGPQVFTKPGEIYAVYLPTAKPSGTLDLSALTGKAKLRWFNPRTGQFAGDEREVSGGKAIAIGDAPAETEQDWVVLVKRVAAKPAATEQGSAITFPDKQWESRPPEQLGLASAPLDELAAQLGGDGCVIRDGCLAKSWGNIERHKDWASAAKPVLSTLLLAAVADGKLRSVDAHVKDLGWEFHDKDAALTFRQLANMTSGYCCAEPPGAAWGYNDFAIQLYAKSLERVFDRPLDEAFRNRFAALELEDGEFFGSRDGRGVSASVRDFARLGWLWLNEGTWRGEQILPRQLVRGCFRPGVPADLPRTAGRTDDYLAIGSYGGGTDQTPFGPGVYGFNFWFNTPDVRGTRAWPALPPDAFQANGMWNRDTVTIIPSLRMVVAVRGAARGKFQPGDPANDFNQAMALIAKAARAPHANAGNSTQPPSTRAFGSSAHHWRRIRDDKRFIQPIADQPAYDDSQVREIVGNILLFQRVGGGWPKDYDMLAVLTPEQRVTILATRNRDDTSFDNSNGHSQVDYLARALPLVENDEQVRQACLRGFDWLLAAQLPSGGFPQWYPRTSGYHGHITFNDGAMIGILNVLQDAATGAEQWKWLDDMRRSQAKDAVARGVDCILKCQIVVDGTPTGWCQQHDAETFAPTSARTFELASVCPQDTAQIIEFIERLENPSPKVLAASKTARDWLARVALKNTRVLRVPASQAEFQRHAANFDVVVVREIGAPPIWARHYEIETDRPIFAGRDAVKRYALAEIERERRTGTAWYGSWPQAVLREKE
jgi:PelA/Pel-15E family pectate lyase